MLNSLKFTYLNKAFGYCLLLCQLYGFFFKFLWVSKKVNRMGGRWTLLKNSLAFLMFRFVSFLNTGVSVIVGQYFFFYFNQLRPQLCHLYFYSTRYFFNFPFVRLWVLGVYFWYHFFKLLLSTYFILYYIFFFVNKQSQRLIKYCAVILNVYKFYIQRRYYLYRVYKFCYNSLLTIATESPVFFIYARYYDLGTVNSYCFL